jgi:hypothetical protein
MTKQELLKRLMELMADDDYEQAHIDADKALLEYIADEAISVLHQRVARWYG